MPKIKVPPIELKDWALPLTYNHRCIVDDSKPSIAGCEYVRAYIEVKRCGNSRCQRCYPHGFPCSCKEIAKP